ncbi:hypothetical protein DL766_004850 [Monosporascus sp. MC13-8B]|uniref:Uncharacterized protein n=1 Tax=Monosporascus cannonballus TaxID=155416 RepID=A0ABY0H0E0_9PEZI|nr:hypothetical protein DL762_007014 [Monosporascus cannonballus]RYP00604.1 hypothetical protein DL763_000658 [Monosporascus cannonballus]RYP30507.1 hypothetical protein DL766_004850 [Monosporascus sp. MC13-8B]
MMQDTPFHTLAISKSSDDSVVVTSRRATDSLPVPLYVVCQNSVKTKMEIRYADGHVQQQQAGGEPIALITFHFFSWNIDLTLHGVDFRMKRKNPLGGHSFRYPGLKEEMEWKRSSLLGSGVKLVDSCGRTIAVYKKKLGGFLGGRESGFHIYDSVEDGMFMDAIVVTGLAAAEYARQSDKDWKWLEELL